MQGIALKQPFHYVAIHSILNFVIKNLSPPSEFIEFYHYLPERPSHTLRSTGWKDLKCSKNVDGTVA